MTAFRGLTIHVVGYSWYNRLEMETEGKQLRATCPHCGSPLDAGAQMCSGCGRPYDASSVRKANPQPMPYIPHASLEWAVAPIVADTLRAEATGHSVVLALTPRRPATWAFWVGLVMSVGALVFAVCPLLLALALALDPQSEDPAGFLGGGLLISACVVVGLLVPGIILVAVGRPRRF
jgi:hypothetical protein